MIVLTGKPGEAGGKIRFTPRGEFKKTHPIVEKALVYGHACPRCSNVVQALFRTDKLVDLWPYEETNVISTSQDEKKAGTLLRIVPNFDTKLGYSAYTITPLRTSRGLGQHLSLKNHILKYAGIEQTSYSPDRYFETGDRTCEFTGVFALREELMMKDMCLIHGMSSAEMETYDFPSVMEFIKKGKNYGYMALAPFGDAPPVILFDRKSIADRYPPLWKLQNTLKPYKKQKATA